MAVPIFTSGSLVLVMSFARVLVIRFHETPKYLLCKGDNEKVIALFQRLCQKYDRQCDLTLEALQAPGRITTTHSAKSLFSSNEVLIHFRGLFSTRTLIGLAYPLFYVFLPEYLASRGAEFGQTSTSITWRNYVLAQFCSIWGPVVAGYMCKTRLFGRRYTMALGALVSSKFHLAFEITKPVPSPSLVVFFFTYTAVRNNAENVGFNCATSFAINIYYGTLYAYSPEVLPSAHRATGNGIAFLSTAAWVSSLLWLRHMETRQRRCPSLFVLRCSLLWQLFRSYSPLSQNTPRVLKVTS
jgi:hypothetical protein